MRPLLLFIVLCGATACRGPDAPRRPAPAGDAERGRALIQTYGCATCHTIPGIPRARAQVGPPLWGMADRAYIGGVLPNTEANMIRWLQDPPAVDPRTLMPNMGVTERDARDIAAYLFTLRAETVGVRGFFGRAVGRRTPRPRGAVSRRFE